eukprot:CAMPEP_0182441508 /NCGR_PEP_ID=MMETSP1172-20130603/471_1 /TAXON_ID=708627 /ORGANISM="Timspurckia oligopyrenoides, Strain CCMP3278" /LENGTH=845 /DNA_ID=CAMNT_0024635845 /DNA_START=27 /DNA_END=2564 /DNA_ORIENTATION=+
MSSVRNIVANHENMYGVKRANTFSTSLFGPAAKGMRLHLFRARLRINFSRTFLFFSNSLWTFPVLSILFNVTIGFVMSSIDSNNSRTGVMKQEFAILFNGSADQAETIFTYVGGIVMSLTGVVFSLSIVAFQVAGVTYSPRLIYKFMRKAATRIVLCTFLGTFAYTYACLLTVKDRADVEYAPIVAVNVLSFYVFGVIFALVYYLDFTVQSMAVSNILDDVAAETIRAIENTTTLCSLPVAVDDDDYETEKDGEKSSDNNNEKKKRRGELIDIDSRVKLPIVPERAYVIYSLKTGYLLKVATAFVAELAKQHRIVIRFRAHVGDYVVGSSPVAWVWRKMSDDSPVEPISDFQLQFLTQQLKQCMWVAERRSVEQDIPFGLVQLADIAKKALSPGVNDPTTAMETLDRLGNVFEWLSIRQIDPFLIYKDDDDDDDDDDEKADENRVPLVALPRQSFAKLLDLVVDPIRVYGIKDSSVMTKLLRFLGTIGSQVMPFRKVMQLRCQHIQMHIETIVEAAERSLHPDSRELETIKRAAEEAFYIIHSGKSDRVKAFSKLSFQKLSDHGKKKESGGESDDSSGEPQKDKDNKLVVSSQNSESVQPEQQNAQQQSGREEKGNESSKNRENEPRSVLDEVVNSENTVSSSSSSSSESAERGVVFEDLDESTKRVKKEEKPIISEELSEKLYFACRRGNLESVQQTIEKLFGIENTTGDADAAAGTETSSSSSDESHNERERKEKLEVLWKGLSCAGEYGRLQIVQHILDFISAEYENKEEGANGGLGVGWSECLMKAVVFGHYEIVEEIIVKRKLTHVVEISDIKNENQQSILDVARERERADIIELLIQHG